MQAGALIRRLPTWRRRLEYDAGNVGDELKKVMKAREAAESEIKALQLQAEASR